MRRIPLFLISGMFLLGSAFSAFSQEAIRATMDEAGVIKLPESPSPVQVYEFEISELNFENVQEAVDFFQPFNSDEAFVRPVISQGIAVLYLKGDGTKTVQQWNAFLSEHPLPIADLKSDASDTQPNNPNK